MVEIEKYKTASATAQLENLKNQLNPHFLFNNLSVLSSLVYQNQDKAVDFINELSKVYRYVLDSKNAELVNLQRRVRFSRTLHVFVENTLWKATYVLSSTFPPLTKASICPPCACKCWLKTPFNTTKPRRPTRCR